jgi:hypothetical protein
MANIRRDPHVEGRAARRDLARAVLYAALAVAAWVLIVAAVLGFVALWNLAGGVVHVVRWARARRWERMLDDPATAALVPPLEAQLIPSTPSALVVVGGCLVLVAATIAGAVYLLLAITGRAPVLHSGTGADRSTTFVAWGVGLLAALTVAAVVRLRRWRVARAVERLSSDPTIAPSTPVPADIAAHRSALIPELDVVFDGVSFERSRLGGVAPAAVAANALDILYLRLFDNVAGTTRFLAGPWRRRGYIYLLRSATQVTAAELEQVEDAGSAPSLFISTPAQLDAALAQPAAGPNDEPYPDGFLRRCRWLMNPERGQYPVRPLLCHGSFWKAAVDLLLTRMDLVVLDLTGYVPEHAGTRYELQRVIDRYPIEQVTLLAQPTSDQRFLTAQIHSAWAQMGDASPNAGTGSRTAHVVVGGAA